MTIAKGDPATAPSPTTPERRSHVPNEGTASAAAVEAARKAMLHEARDLKRTRIGADVLCEALLRQGVDVFFSYPGGVILPLYDVLGDYPELRHVLVRHEQGGAHAADGYARVTGRVGVCMGTSGPGATNLVTGIGTALLDSVPMVAITGNVPGSADRQGRVPGDRHQRHHAADDQAQLPGPRRRRPAPRRGRGVPHRPQRAARPRPHRHHEGRAPAGDARRAPHRGRGRRGPARLPARTPNRHGRQLKLAATEIDERKATGDPRRPRRPPRRGLGRAARLRREDPDPRRVDAARDRGHATRTIRSPTATWACTAGSTSTGRSRPPTCCSPSGCASTIESPATFEPMRRTRGSSTSISIRPRSARTSPSRFPIVADAKKRARGADPDGAGGRARDPTAVPRPAR